MIRGRAVVVVREESEEGCNPAKMLWKDMAGACGAVTGAEADSPPPAAWPSGPVLAEEDTATGLARCG